MGACISSKRKAVTIKNSIDKIHEERLINQQKIQIFQNKAINAPLLQLEKNKVYSMRLRIKSIEKSFITDEGQGISTAHSYE